ncbi:MAG: hypothetical protein NT079_05780 [Candidatus Omnitrophica bacterium]|nr:hypothetical protein [Candidatus Omnitrophota bacterium]
MNNLNKWLLSCLLVLCAGTLSYAETPYGVDQDKIIIEGSTTVLPIAQAAAETFMRQNAETKRRCKFTDKK